MLMTPVVAVAVAVGLGTAALVDDRPAPTRNSAHSAPGRVIPAPVVAEVGYLLGRAGGPTIESAFLRSIVQRTIAIVDLEHVDYERMAELVDTYADFPLGTTDAAVIAVAERLRISKWPRSTIDTSAWSALGTSGHSHWSREGGLPRRVAGGPIETAGETAASAAEVTTVAPVTPVRAAAGGSTSRGMSTSI